ncbi:MAG: LysR family transcriptional regulator [Thermodesulfobacteriota bacterium]|nr:LysR family transcriptional regulator [Thermodesulfobacteriota bacterium]
MNIHQVRIFYTAAQVMSITKTAKKMHLSQPSVSIQIKDLEESLGVKLFDRINRKISLTDAGKVFYSYAQRILNLIDETNIVMKDFGSGDVGSLAIGASNTIANYILPRYLGEFKENNPRVDISLSILNRQDAIEQCLGGDIDVAFVQEVRDHPDLRSELCMLDELVVVCSPRHRWASMGPLSISTLNSEAEPIIMREEGSGTRDLIEYAAEMIGAQLNIAMEMGNTEGIKRAVEANLGIAIISKNVIKREIKYKKLVSLEIRDLDTRRRFYIVCSSKRRPMPYVKRFYDFIVEKRQLPEDALEG